MSLCPTTKRTTFVRQLWSVVDVNRTSTYNWTKMVLDWLCEEARKFQTKKQSYYGDCILLLVYVYIIRVRVEGLVVPDVVPRMAGMSDELVRQHITICKVMGGLACGEVVPGGDGWRTRGCQNFDRPDTQQRYSQML